MPSDSDNEENWLLHNHAEYEVVASELRKLAGHEAWPDAREKFERLSDALEDHMAMEEQIIFPTYDLMVGARNSPTGEMRREHDRIRACMVSLSRSLDAEDVDSTLHDSNSLDEMMEAHHRSEEGTFLPNASLVLLSRRDEVMERLRRRDWTREA